MSRDMKVVYRALDIAQADIVVAWLERQGITALVKDRLAAGTLPTSLIVAPEGIEVCVMDPDQVDRAIVLLREHDQEGIRSEKADEGAGRIEVECEECGQTASFTSAQQGTVQNCPQCNAYMDVPDIDEARE